MPTNGDCHRESGKFEIHPAFCCRGREEGRVVGTELSTRQKVFDLRAKQVFGPCRGQDSDCVPPHTKIALNGATAPHGGDRFGGRLLGVRRYGAIHIGGSATNVDNNDVTHARLMRATVYQEFNSCQDCIRSRAVNQSLKTSTTREFLAADYMPDEYLPDGDAGWHRIKDSNAGEDIGRNRRGNSGVDQPLANSLSHLCVARNHNRLIQSAINECARIV